MHALVELREKFLAQRSTIYANTIEATRAPMPNHAGFIESTKIKIAKTDGASILEKSCYSGH